MDFPLIFKSESFTHNNTAWNNSIDADDGIWPTWTDRPLPDNKLERLRQLNRTYYCSIPNVKPTTPNGPASDCSVTLFNIATDWIRKNFINSILFPGIADFFSYDLENEDHYSVIHILYSSHSHAEIKRSISFLKENPRQPQRRVDLVTLHLLNSENLTDICLLLLNTKKMCRPEDPYVALILHLGFMVINCRQTLAYYDSDYRKLDDHFNRNQFFINTENISVPNLYKHIPEYTNTPEVHTHFLFFRNTIWCKPSPNKHHQINKTIWVTDVDNVCWHFEPYIHHFTGQGFIYKLGDHSREEGDKPYPNIRNIQFRTQLKETRSGGAVINPAELFADDRKFVKLFKYLPESLIVLDTTKPNDSGPRHFHDQWITVTPLIVYDGTYFMIFVESSYLDNVHEKDKRESVYTGDINLLSFWPLRIPDCSLLPPDNLLPIKRKKVPFKLEPIIESDNE